jgi:hypothetical protein
MLLIILNQKLCERLVLKWEVLINILLFLVVIFPFLIFVFPIKTFDMSFDLSYDFDANVVLLFGLSKYISPKMWTICIY